MKISDLRDHRGQIADVLNAMCEDAQMPFNTCCMGAAVYGPSRCTCWVNEYDLTQQAATGNTAAEFSKCCNDCAYRSDSPERSATTDHAHSADEPGGMPELPANALFFCHKGMRKIVAAVHEPTGLRVEFTGGDNYAAPNNNGMPILANGDYAPLCAGFAATTGHTTATAQGRLLRQAWGTMNKS